jgi:uncharacterized membrane protein
MRDMARLAAAGGKALPLGYHRLYRWWYLLVFKHLQQFWPAYG